MEIRPATTAGEILAAAGLFDEAPQGEATSRFLDEPNHHLLLAWEGNRPVGFVSGVEMTHPDKGTEMFLYELGVAEAARRRGVGTALVERLGEVARSAGCYGMWVLTDAHDVPALATYRSAGADEAADQVLLGWSF